MKTAKLVTGILCIVFTFFVLFQSCAAGIVDAIGNTGGNSGMAGFFVALLMLSGGIIEVVTRKSVKNGGAISSTIIFFMATIIGFINAGIYTDLYVWSIWCLILGVLNLVSIFVGRNDDDDDDDDE